MSNFKTDPPPILQDIGQELLEYLICPERLPIHEYERNQEYWPRTPDPTSLYHYDNSPLSTTLKVQRNLNTGEIIDFQEVPIQGAGTTARNSTSLARAPAPSSEPIWGSVSSFPFWPAGLPDPISELPILADNLNTDELLTVPPGFNRGLVFEKDGCTVVTDTSEVIESQKIPEINNVVNLMDILDQNDDFIGIWETKEKEVTEVVQITKEVDLPEEKEVIPKEIPVLKISNPPPQKSGQVTKWVVLLDTSKPVTDFREKIPEMAIEYEFELDTFQKLAILQLEQHNHVFVAAHTSAGKTVVAEYAIALSQKHMTRAIYTSPIKALSNQKYRDFRQKFKDVGLVTGDFQINMKASCLIMTTEILRSMLYGGSEVTRDLEYVIFDEVHYINDEERGHVWEQVLIMLPAHVCVVLLSATVPNTIEFADWLGRTYQKNIYVVTTQKRPVPLQHYLYTGCGGSTRDNRFLLLNASGTFLMNGYNEAVESLKKRKEKKEEKEHMKIQKLPFKKNFYNFKQERTMWSGLINHLNKNELLPVVAFTFSRKVCDTNAENLMYLDLTSEVEKFHIHTFFEKCIKGLKEPDRNIPQILMMRHILSRGIGVHHSGILPIIKEMIEMLFQKQLVKLLFATETFAMGVNMPARTVIFDSINKHDGRELRNLLPAEYIQMAGRAGRRGLDETGTVILLCKGSVPPIVDLQKMMLGKPSQLQSQFKVTYGMVLTLLRVESLSVEGMMSRSFHEADHQKKMDLMRAELKRVEKKLEEEWSKELSDYMQPLAKFYTAASHYLRARKETIPEIMSSHQVVKEMIPGKVLLITHGPHMNKLGLLLEIITKSNKKTYKVLVLTNKNNTHTDEKEDQWYKMLALKEDEIFCPEGNPDHDILTIKPTDIFEITSKAIKVDSNLVLKDWGQRQIPRFKDNPPSESCKIAIQELLNLTLNTVDKCNDNRAAYLDFTLDLKINDFNLYREINHLNKLKDDLLNCISSTQIPNFEEQFAIVYGKKSLEDRRNDLQDKLSFHSMPLYPEYQKRIHILRELNYVNSQNRVELKGQVACEMGMNELLITELVLRNIFIDFEPSEVAALLSALVFQAKTQCEPNLTERLKEGIAAIEAVDNEIKRLEQECGIQIDEKKNKLNFKLVEVVYEWANAKPFAEIKMLTDVQEGIIVRCIQQLNETICDVRGVARLTGDPKLQTKMEEASAAIKRDIVFAASLYTQHENL